MPRAGQLRSLLAAPYPVSGCWCTLPHHAIAGSLSSAGFSTILVDLQHGHVSFDSLAPLIYAIESAGSAVIVRVGWSDPDSVIRALDLGAAGVIAPMINTAAEAAAFASSMRYPPHGERSYSPNRWNADGVAQADEGVVCIPMIETAKALHNVEQIAAVDGVDGLFLGPSDLALSLGLPLGAKTHPRLLEAVDATVLAAERHGVFVATIAQDQQHAKDLVERGVKLVTLGSDFGFVALGARKAADALRTMQTPDTRSGG